MSKRGQRNRRTTDVLNEINKGVQSIAENTGKDKKTDDLEGDKNNKSRLGIIVTVITLLASLVTIGGFTIKDLTVKFSEAETAQQYKIYLSSEYTKLKVSAETDITAVLNFETDAISITGYLDSVKDGDTLYMIRKNETEWHKKVVFQNTGTYKVIATATAPNGDIVEGLIEIEVIF